MIIPLAARGYVVVEVQYVVMARYQILAATSRPTPVNRVLLHDVPLCERPPMVFVPVPSERR